MKKVVLNPDGTEETIEGSPEEIAEYVRRSSVDRTTSPPLSEKKDQKKLIKG